MKKLCVLTLLFVLWTLLLTAFIPAQTYTYYGPHLTDQSPWINSVSVYNNGDQEDTFQITVWDGAGLVVVQQEFAVPANSSVVLVLTNFPGYVLGPNEIALDPVEGTFVVATENPKLKPKVSFRYGDSVSLCEFFLQETLGWEYILPNTVQAHFSWTGIALMNPTDEPLTIMVNAYQEGVLVGQTELTDILPHTKYVRLSDGFWPGIGYADFDQVRISGTQVAFPPPMSITGDDIQDRHLFFNAAVTALTSNQYEAGDLYTTDSIVGNLFIAPAGSFTQGSDIGEVCREEHEGPQFTHVLTRNIAVMETEVSRQMWSDLRALQPDLPNDPTWLNTSSGSMDDPVQYVAWRQALLFANLLSAQQGLTRCYYTDAAMTDPIDATNYIGGPYYCNFGTDGYRLPTEGEWEYFCRAGTTTAFWVNEQDYAEGNCTQCTPGLMPDLENAAIFCANRPQGQSGGTTAPIGTKLANPWNLKDVHGNVYEFCWDKYSETYPAGPVTDYAGPDTINNIRVIRGGAWVTSARDCRSASRADQNYNLPGFDVGFRLVRTIQ